MFLSKQVDLVPGNFGLGLMDEDKALRLIGVTKEQLTDDVEKELG